MASAPVPEIDALRALLPTDATLVLYCRTPATADPGAAAAIAIVREPASSRLRHTLSPNPGSTKHSQVATCVAGKDGERVDVLEATSFAAQLLRGHPVYSAMLLADNDILYISRQAFELFVHHKRLVGAAFAKACAHQAHGLVRALLDGSIDDVAIATHRWGQVGELVAAVLRVFNLDEADVDETAVQAAGGGEGGRWRAVCERCVTLAKASELSTPSGFRDDAIHFLEGWLASLPADETAALPAAPPPAAAPSRALETLLDTLGRPKPATQIISAVRSGSSMYGLALPTSDADYHLTYLGPAAELLSLRESLELRKLHFSRAVGAPYGAAKEGLTEFTAVELSHFLQVCVSA